MSVTRLVARRAVRIPAIRSAALSLAHRRKRGLVLCYHRVAPRLQVGEATPTHATSELSLHLEALTDIGDIVGLKELLADRPRRRPAFALTFDDDYRSHVTEVLPLLTSAQVPATFFLSGRSLHDLGSYWWEQLDQAVAADGFEPVKRALGVEAGDVPNLALALETNAEARGRLAAGSADPDALAPEDIKALAAAGMTIGFHTVEHPLLPMLADDQLAAAVSKGRAELESLVGEPIRYFSYPHGRAGSREIQAVRAAGYDAAFTTSSAPYDQSVNRWRVGRWVPNAAPATMPARVALRLNAGTRAAR